ncbi:MAG: hypothetical protein HY738_16175 [Bacteroidia bacterium]|nr:hypothetical protein [Bacteroidia bacterium]
MLQKIRKSKLTKLLACFLAVNMTISLFDVRPVLALTGGPDQIEFNNFRPANSTEMVNLFTGDFSYNIPLLDIDGYPLNIFYDGNVGMNQEASWVGLGWTLNPGAIGREMRGLPDDFKGEELTETFNTTLESEPWGEKDGYGARASVGVSSIVSLAQSLANINNSNNGGYGGFSLSPTYGGSNTVEGNKGLFFNNYNGLGYTLDFTLGNNSSYGISLSYYYVNLFSVNVGLGFSGTFSFNSQKGISISPSISLQGNFSEANNIGTGPIYASNRSRVLSTSFNSRSGLKEFAISQASGNETILTTSHSTSYTTRITLGSPTYFPQLPFNTKITNHGNVLNIGIYSNLVLAELFMYKSFQWYYNTIELSDNINRKIKAYGYFYPKNDTETPGELEILDCNRETDGTFTETTPHLPITNYTYDFYNVMGQGLYSHYRPYRNDIGTVNDLHGEMLQDGLVKTSEFGGGLLSRYEAKGTITTKSRGFTDIWIDNNSALSRLRFQDKTTDYPKYEPFYFKKSGEKTVFNKSYYEDRDDLSSYGDEYPVSLVLSKGHYIGKVPTIASEQGNSFFDFILEYLPSGYLSILNPPTYENNLGVTTHNLHFLISMNSHSTKEKNIPPDNRKGLDSREKRNELFTFYTADEASKFGSVHTIQSYNTMYSNASNGSEITLPTSYNRYDSGTNPLRKSHHISEISVIRPDGARYIYGVPVYNTSRKDVLFNISGAFEKTDLSEFDQEANLVKYTPNIDNTYNSNDNGKDHFFKSTELPPYAHSYLISAVLSPDYIDLTGNGPSDDDIGNYVEFNYTRKYNDYKWRIPYEQNMGDYLEEMKTNDDDDKAAYIFGEKEIWYVHSIESKNYIAEFYLEPRDDGLGVANENGGTDTGKKLMKLKKIMLFAKEDRRKEWSDPSQTYKAVPLKTVCFEYADDSGNEYTLCKNVPNNTNTGTNNNNNGKLTLRKIYFTYGNSLKGRLSPYVFEYSSFNPDYNRMYLDRWGNYKPNTDPLYQDYPYAEQDKTFADQYAGAWKLNRIELPSGASITIEYEADDYSYVHDKLAANMFNVAGFSPVGSVYSASSCQLHTYDGDTPEEPNLRLFVQLNSPVVDAGSFADYYLKADENYKIVQTKKIMKYLYFSCFVDLTGDNIINDYEYVSGYAEIMGFGISSDPSIAYIDLKSVTLNDFDSNIPLLNDIMTLEVNPIAKQAWQITRRNNPLLIWKNCSTTDDMYQCFTQVMGMDISSLQPFGINYALLKKKYGVNVDLAKSWVRLNTPDRYKLGGGYRVKKIVMNDAWSGMSGGENSETGFIYNYKIQGTTESTGVAAYEPFIGNDENNCRQPVFFNVKHVLFPDDNFYQEKPYGESYYPAPIVGYREITVSPYIPAGVNLTKNAAGYSKYRFYTTKDFPVKVRTTDKQTLKTVLESESMLEQLLGIRNYYQYGVSQGYAIELNDMHGKLKAIESYSSKNEQISKVSYKYKSNGNRLDNHTLIIILQLF